MLAAVIRRADPHNLLGQLEEPLLGDPIRIRYRAIALSQDLVHSVHEYYRILQHLPSRAAGPSIAEIGAGYGRLAWVFLCALPRVRYVIVDVPPARGLAEWYLTTLRPDVPVFRYKEDAKLDEIRAALDEARLIFLDPHQFETLPQRSLDAVVSVSSLHEMMPPDITAYFRAIDRLVDGVFYGTVITERDYPVPPQWQTVYRRPHPFLPQFFEALYRIS
jgi:putative sugar O-methyltransferase